MTDPVNLLSIAASQEFLLRQQQEIVWQFRHNESASVSAMHLRMERQIAVQDIDLLIDIAQAVVVEQAAAVLADLLTNPQGTPTCP